MLVRAFRRYLPHHQFGRFAVNLMTRGINDASLGLELELELWPFALAIYLLTHYRLVGGAVLLDSLKSVGGQW